MDFLKQQGIDETVIQKIKETYPSSVLYDFSINEEVVSKNIAYLQKIGVKCIDELLLTRLDLFMLLPEEFENKWKKKENHTLHSTETISIDEIESL